MPPSLAPSTRLPRKTAVLVNLKAQFSTRKKVAMIRSLIDADYLFLTSSLAEARQAIRKILDEKFEVICVGGGDGTFMQATCDLISFAPHPLPLLFPLRLGSGNAICDVARSSKADRPGLAHDLQSIQAGQGRVRPLGLLQVGRKVTYFTGVGLDAQFATTFHCYRDFVGEGALGFMCRPGIILGAAIQSLGRLLLRSLVHVKIINRGPQAYRLDSCGQAMGSTLKPGEILYKGPLTIAAASTIIPYSSGVRFFPFADRWPDHFQLRLSNAGLFEIATHLPSVFKGVYFNPKTLFDFAVSSIRIELKEPGVYHVGGDPQGLTDKVDVSISPYRIPVLRL